jgi:hypothetical protein
MLASAATELIMSGFDAWKYRADREATILAYSQTERGGADTCDCAGCRNFRVTRVDCFPPEFIALLSELAADSDDVAQAFRDDVAHRSDMIAPTVPT